MFISQIAVRLSFELMVLSRDGTLRENGLQKIEDGLKVIRVLKTAEKVSEQIEKGIAVEWLDYAVYSMVRDEFFGVIHLGKIEESFRRYDDVYKRIHKILAKKLYGVLLKIIEKCDGLPEKLQTLKNEGTLPEEELQKLRKFFDRLYVELS